MKNLLKQYLDSQWVERVITEECSINEDWWKGDKIGYEDGKLDNCPSFLGMHYDIDGQSNVVDNKGWKSYKGCWYCDQARRIIRGSAGMNVDKLYSKVRPIIAKCHDYGSHPYNWMRRELDMAVYKNGKKYYVDEAGKWWSGEKYGRYKELYVDKDKVIKEKPYRRKHTRVYDARKHYAWVTEKRKEDKDRRMQERKRADALLKLLKEPQVFIYYRALYNKRKALLASMAWDERYVRGLAESKYLKYYVNKDTKRKRDLQQIETEMYHLESGQYDVFYSSNVYLYSLQKECHHF